MVDDDGKITVAPEALAATEDRPIAIPVPMETGALSTPVDAKQSLTPRTLNRTTPLRQRFQQLSIASSPYLSPFRASLQKLKGISGSQQQSSIHLDSDSDDSNNSSTVGY